MNFLINASNVRFGGGITVVSELLRHTLPHCNKDTFLLVCPAGEGYEKLECANLKCHFVPEKFHNNYRYKWLYSNYQLPKIATAFKADKLVSLGNVAFPSQGIPHLLLIQNAWLVYPESIVWKRLDTIGYIKNQLMVWLMKSQLKHASAFAFQTELMQQQFEKEFPDLREPAYLIPNAPANSLKKNTYDVTFPLPGRLDLLFLSKYYPHKNFDILIAIGRAIIKKNLPVSITLTIDAGESPLARNFLKKVKKEKLQHILKNNGSVPSGEISGIMQQHHGLFLPTLLESFTGTYLEAMQAARPIFTSDLPFARDILKDAAIYFDPLDADSIVGSFEKTLNDPDTLLQSVQKGAEILAGIPGWPQTGKYFSEILHTFQ